MTPEIALVTVIWCPTCLRELPNQTQANAHKHPTVTHTFPLASWMGKCPHPGLCPDKETCEARQQ